MTEAQAKERIAKLEAEVLRLQAVIHHCRQVLMVEPIPASVQLQVCPLAYAGNQWPHEEKRKRNFDPHMQGMAAYPSQKKEDYKVAAPKDDDAPPWDVPGDVDPHGPYCSKSQMIRGEGAVMHRVYCAEPKGHTGEHHFERSID